MKAHSARFDSRSGPRWWSALLSLVIALSLIAPSSHLCALTETLTGHSHAALDGRSHSHNADAHDGQAATERHDGGVGVQSVPEPETCCSDAAITPFVVATVASRFAGPKERATDFSFALATLPVVQDVFALTTSHGRDGPSSDQPFRSHFAPSSLLGRAPPVSV